MTRSRWLFHNCTAEALSARSGLSSNSGMEHPISHLTQANLHRLYMSDGIYQSVICFFMAYLLFRPANFVTSSGLSVDDQKRVGVFVASTTVAVVNLYILLNTYQWDWLMLLLVFFSILIIWFWTGVYTAFSSSQYFYKAAPQVYGQLTFWLQTLLTVFISLLPRFAVKTFQKLYVPYDVDVVREQVRQGRFAYLDQYEAHVPPKAISSPSSSDFSQPVQPGQRNSTIVPDDERPIYPPSVAATGTTHNPRSQNGSDGTDLTGPRQSLEHPTRPSVDRPRPSFDRMRNSMDRIRPSYEASNSFTSAALLTRMESSQSPAQSPLQSPMRTVHGPSALR